MRGSSNEKETREDSSDYENKKKLLLWQIY